MRIGEGDKMEQGRDAKEKREREKKTERKQASRINVMGVQGGKTITGIKQWREGALWRLKSMQYLAKR